MTDLNRQFLKPKNPKVVVRNPDGGHLAVDGQWVPKNTYWHKRKADGDVIEAKAPKKPSVVKENT